MAGGGRGRWRVPRPALTTRAGRGGRTGRTGPFSGLLSRSATPSIGQAGWNRCNLSISLSTPASANPSG